MEPLNPIELAQQNAANSRQDSLQRRIDRQLEQDTAELPTFWQGYNPDLNRHTITRSGHNATDSGISISSGGYTQGQRIDAAYGPNYTAIDTRPYIPREQEQSTSVSSAIQVAMLIYADRQTLPSAPGDPVLSIPGSFYLKLSDQRLHVIDPSLPHDVDTGDDAFIDDKRLAIDLIPVAKDKWVIPTENAVPVGGTVYDIYPTIYYFNQGQVTAFDGEEIPIPGATFGEQQWIYPSTPSTPLINYLPKGRWNTYPDYYYPPVYNQSGYLPGSYGQLSIAPYNRKAVALLNTRYNGIIDNWLDLLRASTYKIQSNYPATQRSRESVTMRLTTSDLAVMGFSPADEIRAGTDGSLLGTFASPGTGWQQAQIEVRKAGVSTLLSIVFYRGIPIDA